VGRGQPDQAIIWISEAKDSSERQEKKLGTYINGKFND
jgi:hypothetical protein